MEQCEEPEKMKKPNSFEYIGNVTIKKKLLTREAPYCLCMNLPVMTVVTVNKVQDLYKTPVYEFKGENEVVVNDEKEAILMMNQYLIEKKKLAISSFYSKMFFPSVHIGDFVLSTSAMTSTPPPLVGVVLPVFNNSEYLEEAISSILN